MAHKLPWMVLTIEGGVIKPDENQGNIAIKKE
jgi:hypothetical protein